MRLDLRSEVLSLFNKGFNQKKKKKFRKESVFIATWLSLVKPCHYELLLYKKVQNVRVIDKHGLLYKTQRLKRNLTCETECVNDLSAPSLIDRTEESDTQGSPHCLPVEYLTVSQTQTTDDSLTCLWQRMWKSFIGNQSRQAEKEKK